MGKSIKRNNYFICKVFILALLFCSLLNAENIPTSFIKDVENNSNITNRFEIRLLWDYAQHLLLKKPMHQADKKRAERIAKKAGIAALIISSGAIILGFLKYRSAFKSSDLSQPVIEFDKVKQFFHIEIKESSENADWNAWNELVRQNWQQIKGYLESADPKNATFKVNILKDNYEKMGTFDESDEEVQKETFHTTLIELAYRVSPFLFENIKNLKNLDQYVQEEKAKKFLKNQLQKEMSELKNEDFATIFPKIKWIISLGYKPSSEEKENYIQKLDEFLSPTYRIELKKLLSIPFDENEKILQYFNITIIPGQEARVFKEWITLFNQNWEVIKGYLESKLAFNVIKFRFFPQTTLKVSDYSIVLGKHSLEDMVQLLPIISQHFNIQAEASQFINNIKKVTEKTD